MTAADAPIALARQRLPFIVPLLAVGTFLMITTEYIVAGLLQEIAADLTVSIARVGLLITAFAIGMIIGSPTMALATVRLPRRTTLVLALLVFAAGHVIAALTSTFAVVFAARVVTAVASGAFWAVASAVATTAAGPADSSRALGIMMSGVGLATVAGVPLGSLAGQFLGWRGTFWALAALAAIAAAVIARFTPADTNPQVPSVSAQIRAVINPRMAILIVVTVFATGGYMTTFSYISPLVTDRTGLPAWAVPLVFVAFGAGALIGTNLSGCFADQRPLTTYITTTAASLLLITLLVLLSDSTVAVFILIFLLGVAGMGIPPVGTGLAVRFAPSASALAAAVAVSAFNGGTAIGTAIGATALDSALGVLGPPVVGIVMTLFGMVTLAIMAIRGITKRPEPSPS